MKLWKDVKDNYKAWGQNERGYYIHPTEKFKFKIGDKVKIAYDAEIGNNTIIGNGVEIGNKTKIGDDSIIGNKANIRGEVVIGNCTTIGNWAVISDEVVIGDWAVIGDWTKISDKAKISDGAIIGYHAEVGYEAEIGQQLTYIIGSKHQVYLYDPKKRLIGIDYFVFTIDEWLEKYEQIGKENDYTEQQIIEYKRYIDLFDIMYKKDE